MTDTEIPRAATGDMAELGVLIATMASALRRESADGVDAAQLVQFAARALPHVGHCAVTVLRPRAHPRTLAASDPLPLAVDELQYELDEGPCLAAACGDDVVLVNDLAQDRRWPRFAPLCVERTGVRAMLSIRLRLAEGDRAAINFYATEPDVITDVDVSVGSLLAPMAASAVQADLYRQEVSQLSTALTTSRQIGVAVGILMSQRRLTYEQAFDQLREASQHLNVKLRDVAAEVERSGTLPAEPTRRTRAGK